jgi:hypothetical protein
LIFQPFHEGRVLPDGSGIRHYHQRGRQKTHPGSRQKTRIRTEKDMESL